MDAVRTFLASCDLGTLLYDYEDRGRAGAVVRFSRPSPAVPVPPQEAVLRVSRHDDGGLTFTVGESKLTWSADKREQRRGAGGGGGGGGGALQSTIRAAACASWCAVRPVLRALLEAELARPLAS